MSSINGSGSTLDLMDFTTIRDGGIIETPTSYAMIVRVEPTDWLVLSTDRRESIYRSFLSYLRSLSFPTQILTMSTAYNPEPYLEGVAVDDELVIGSNYEDDSDVVPDESPLLDYGRKYHAEWVREVIDVADIRDREFFVAVAVPKGEDRSEESPLNSLLSKVQGESEPEEKDEDAYIEEVKARASHVASKLPQVQVETTLIDTRPAVLEILYEVYNNEKPAFGFTQSNFTRPSGVAEAAALSSADTVGDTPDPEQSSKNESEYSRVSDTDPEPEPESEATHLAPIPDGGFAHPDLADRVSKDRILRWYARNIGPIGHGERPIIPASVYAGLSLAILSVGLALGGLGGFVWSLEAAPRGADIYWTARTASFAGLAVSLPAFLLSLVILLPTGRRAKLVGTAGLSVTAYATVLFVRAYPFQWDLSAPAQTTFTIQVYAAGVFALVFAVAVAIRSQRRLNLPIHTDGDDGRDGGIDVESDADDDGPVVSDVAADGGQLTTAGISAAVPDTTDQDSEEQRTETESGTADSEEASEKALSESSEEVSPAEQPGEKQAGEDE